MQLASGTSALLVFIAQMNLLPEGPPTICLQSQLLTSLTVSRPLYSKMTDEQKALLHVRPWGHSSAIGGALCPWDTGITDDSKEPVTKGL